MFCHGPPPPVPLPPAVSPMPFLQHVSFHSVLPAADLPAAGPFSARIARPPAPARRRTLAPARFARLIAHVRPGAQAKHRAHVSPPFRWDFFAPAPARREAASGRRLLPPHLGPYRSDVKLLIRNISNFREHHICNAAEMPSPSGRGLGEGRAKRGAAGPQRAPPPGSFKRNGPPRRLIPRDENGPFLLRQRGLAAGFGEQRPRPDATFGPDGLLKGPVSAARQPAHRRAFHLQILFMERLKALYCRKCHSAQVERSALSRTGRLGQARYGAGSKSRWCCGRRSFPAAAT